MQHVPSPINQYNPHREPRPESRPVLSTTPLRMPESPFKPTSSLRHRRQSSTITSTGLTMSPSSYNGDAELRGNSDVEAASRYLGEAMGGGEVGRRVVERSSTDEELGRIAQAMVFCSYIYVLEILFFFFFFLPFFLSPSIALSHTFLLILIVRTKDPLVTPPDWCQRGCSIPSTNSIRVSALTLNRCNILAVPRRTIEGVASPVPVRFTCAGPHKITC